MAQRDLSDGLESFYAHLRGLTKAAAHPNGIADPGGYAGPSTHPSAAAGIAANLKAEQTGSRFTENTTDVRDDVGAASVETLPEEAPVTSKGSGNQDKRQPNVGVSNAATGEDPAVEDGYKGNKDDPGTTSVMRTDDGTKYGGWGTQKLAAHIGRQGNAILANLSVGRLKVAGIGDDAPANTHKPGAKPPAKDDKAGKADEGDEAAKGPDGDDPEKVAAALRAGYDLSAHLGGNDDNTAASIAAMIKDAQLSADLTADYVRRHKQADDGSGSGATAPPDDADKSDPGNPGAAGAGGTAGGPMGAGGGNDVMAMLQQLPPDQLQQLIQLVQSGAAGGGDPGMGAGPAGGGGDPGMGGGMGGDQVNDQLAGATQDMGMSPEDLEGMAPKVASAQDRAMVLDLAHRVREHRRSGRYDSTKRASTPAERTLRQETRDWLREVCRGI